eukprot:3941869-Rhodomonas_salina.1
MACSATRDLVCSSCHTCASGQYESTPCAGTTNRVCALCRTCVAGEYESRACTGTVDQVCSACSQCSTGQYEVMPCAAGHDRECRDCSPCGGGTYEARACDALHDSVWCELSQLPLRDGSGRYNPARRGCRASASRARWGSCVWGGLVVSCGPGQFWDQGARTCEPCKTQCWPGEFAVAGSCCLLQDTACVACPEGASCSDGTSWSCAEGHFWDGMACTQCRSACAAGKWVVPGSCGALTDKRCHACPPDALCDGEGLYTCIS